MNTRLLGTIAAIVAASGYGIAYVLSKLAYAEGVSSLTLVSIRFLALFLVHALWIRISRHSVTLPRRLFWITMLIGVALFAGSAGNLSAIVFLPVSLAILIFYTYPIFTLLFESIVYRKRPGLPESIAVGTAFLGLGLALEVTLAKLNLLGIALALLGALGAALNIVAARWVIERIGAVLMTFHMAGAAFLVSGLATWSAGAVAWPESTMGWMVLGAIVVLYCIAIVSMYTSVKWMGSFRTSLVMCVEPLLAIVLALIILDEHLTLQQLTGAILVVGAITVVQRRGKA